MSPLPSSEICWQAVVDSDTTYDGQFVIAVRTTRIYCRPSCPARLPKRENASFYQIPAEAEANGYRACKRCHPKQVDVVDEQAKIVQQLCEHMQSKLDEALTLETLGQAVGWSPYHLQRTFKQVMGITPRQFAEAQRMAHFKTQLQAGVSVTTASLEAGFNSPSSLYAQTEAHIGMTPTAYQKGGVNMTIFYDVVECPLGYLLLAITERGVCRVSMGTDERALIEQLITEFPAAESERDSGYLSDAIEQVLAYLNGWQPHLDLPLDLRLTAFQQRVLQELTRIPYGETRTYGEIAKAIGKPKSARAVGRACATNPVPLVLPCHRVVGSTGKLTGYAFGTERKQYLLDMERTNATDQTD